MLRPGQLSVTSDDIVEHGDIKKTCQLLILLRLVLLSQEAYERQRHSCHFGCFSWVKFPCNFVVGLAILGSGALQGFSSVIQGWDPQGETIYALYSVALTYYCIYNSS